MNPLDISRLRMRFPYSEPSGDELRIDCFMCHDSGSNLEVNVAKGVFHCWRCHYKGKVAKLFTDLGLPFHGGGEPQGPLTPRSRLATAVNGDEDFEPDDIEYDAFIGPNVERDVSYEKAYRFAMFKLGGRLPPAFWGVGRGKLSNRVVIPVLRAGRAVSYQARAIYPWQKVRYLSGRPPGFMSTGTLFYKVGGESDRIVLVEGPFDAEVAHEILGVPAWASFGTSLTRSQLNQLSVLGASILIWMDPDDAGARAAESVGAQLMQMGLPVLIAESETDPKSATGVPPLRPLLGSRPRRATR